MFRRVLLTVLVVLASRSAFAQERRTGGGGGGPPLPSIAPNPRFPFAGTWIGRRSIGEHASPVAFAIQVENGRYSSIMILPDRAHVPLERTRLVGDTLIWESPNSGGGTWVYTARRIGADSLFGSIMLRDAPAGFGPTPPSGNFGVARQTAGGR